MADEAASGGAGSGQAGGSLLISDMSVLLMDDVLHKLHCLDYESQYCAPKDIVPFHALYFATPASHSGLVKMTSCLSVAVLAGRPRLHPSTLFPLSSPFSPLQPPVLSLLVDRDLPAGEMPPTLCNREGEGARRGELVVAGPLE